VPTAFAAGIFCGLAGLGHLMSPGKSDQRVVAMVSDPAMAIVLLTRVVLIGSGI